MVEHSPNDFAERGKSHPHHQISQHFSLLPGSHEASQLFWVTSILFSSTLSTLQGTVSSHQVSQFFWEFLNSHRLSRLFCGLIGSRPLRGLLSSPNLSSLFREVGVRAAGFVLASLRSCRTELLLLFFFYITYLSVLLLFVYFYLFIYSVWGFPIFFLVRRNFSSIFVFHDTPLRLILISAL